MLERCLGFAYLSLNLSPQRQCGFPKAASCCVFASGLDWSLELQITKIRWDAPIFVFNKGTNFALCSACRAVSNECLWEAGLITCLTLLGRIPAALEKQKLVSLCSWESPAFREFHSRGHGEMLWVGEALLFCLCAL